MLRFSVIIPLYNKEKDIFNTLTSVLKQTFSDFEIIIIDDGSTDASVEIVKAIKDNRIKLFEKINEGVSSARNLGVDKSTSEHIAFLDADDFWYPNHLENLNVLIETFPKHVWFASSYEKKHSHKLTTSMESPILNNGKNWHGVVDDFFKYSFIESLTNSSNVVFRKYFFEFLRGFNILYTHGEDTDLWIRAALKEKLIFSNKITVRQNLLGSNRSTHVINSKRHNLNLNNFEEEAKENIYLKKYLDLNRYSQAIKFKLANDKVSFTEHINNLDKKNLNKKQRFLLKQSRVSLKTLLAFKTTFEKFGLRLSAFK